MDVVAKLAEHIVAVRYDMCSPDALLTSKLSIVDTLGAAIAGHAAAGCAPVVKVVRDWGGNPEASVWFDDARVIAPHAALANAVMARAIDYDDALTRGVHLSSALVPAILAQAEARGGLSGRELLTTFTVATDVVARLNAATLDYHGFDPTLTCGIFGVTAATARLRGLTAAETIDAFGIALNEASGTFQSNIDGALVVRLNQGFAACEGMKAAIFAAAGITGVKNVFEGLYGYGHLYSNGRFDVARLAERLGERFDGTETFFKRWPSCGATLAGIDAAVALVETDGVRGEDVASGEVRVGRYHYNLCGTRPFWPGENPSVDAQFSYQYAIANTLLRGRPRLEHFLEPRVIVEPAVGDLARRLRVVADDRFDEAHGVLATRVTVTLRSGRIVERFVQFPRGHFRNAMPAEELIEKFRQNLAFAQQRGYDARYGDRIVETVMALEDTMDVRAMLAWLVPHRRP
ncbi:MAG TPA: MmgE/PrpD family protein [Candidatus Methylomirabilis sp.]|nr:MmgE/PrpD family protein [Candidatus Methylomirabilis sp.]